VLNVTGTETKKSFSILLIEDNRADAGLVREALNENTIPGECVVIEDGDAAIRYIEEIEADNAARCPDLTIIDLNLPKVPGLEVLRALRRSARCRDALVVILSSSDIQADRDSALRLGASRYIRKPLRLEEFMRLGAVFRSLLETDPHRGSTFRPR